MLGEYALGLVALYYLAPPLLKASLGAFRGYAGEGGQGGREREGGKGGRGRGRERGREGGRVGHLLPFRQRISWLGPVAARVGRGQCFDTGGRQAGQPGLPAAPPACAPPRHRQNGVLHQLRCACPPAWDWPAGEVSPAAALDALATQGNVVLIDIRSGREKEAAGIPDLPNNSERAGLGALAARKAERRAMGAAPSGGRRE